jgi:undecaprenyl-diphosphatase
MVAASGLDLLKHHQEFSGEALAPLLAGFVTAFICAYFVMKLFISFLDRFTFTAFGIYRIAFGLLLFGLLYSGVISPESSH